MTHSLASHHHTHGVAVEIACHHITISSHQVTSSHVMSRHVISYHVISKHIMSCQHLVMSCQCDVVSSSSHAMSSPAISAPVTSSPALACCSPVFLQFYLCGWSTLMWITKVGGTNPRRFERLCVGIVHVAYREGKGRRGMWAHNSAGGHGRISTDVHVEGYRTEPCDIHISRHVACTRT